MPILNETYFDILFGKVRFLTTQKGPVKQVER